MSEQVCPQRTFFSVTFDDKLSVSLFWLQAQVKDAGRSFSDSPRRTGRGRPFLRGWRWWVWTAFCKETFLLFWVVGSIHQEHISLFFYKFLMGRFGTFSFTIFSLLALQMKAELSCTELKHCLKWLCTVFMINTDFLRLLCFCGLD